MKRRSPPWGAIEAFITASRAGSFKAAASELGLSPAAFSRRIRSLEDHVDVKLFDRGAPVPSLTAAGRRYLLRLQPGYDAMRAATEWMAPDPERRALRVGVSQSFAVSWLLPRLSAFHARAHGIDLRLQTRSASIDLVGGAADVGIFYGAGTWEHVSVQKLFGVDACIVTGRALADGRAIPRRVEDLAGHRLLDLVSPAGLWGDWLRRAGHPALRPRHHITFDSARVMYEAAVRGLGVALGARPLVEPYLAAGRLQVAFDLTLPLSGAYYMAALPNARRQPAVNAFWHWLAAEAGCAEHTGPLR